MNAHNTVFQDQKEYQEKLTIKDRLDLYYQSQSTKNGLQNIDRIQSYLPEKFQFMQIRRGVIIAHLDMEPVIELMAQGKEFTVISGLNPSSPLHLGHKVVFDILLELQRLGGRIYIPITNDESYVDNKVDSLVQSKKIAYEEIISSIIAFGFKSGKTHLFVDSDYPQIYNVAIYLSKYIALNELIKIFGQNSLLTPGQIFYRGCVQLAQIFLPQLPEFGGPKHTLIPVGIDQHPYVLLARDVANRVKLVPPSEMVFKFLPSLKNPEEKMSGSRPETAVYLSDSPKEIKRKINRAYTGSVSSLVGHQKLGGIPEICSVFSLLQYLCYEDKVVKDLYVQYLKGKINTLELKNKVYKFTKQLVASVSKKKRKTSPIQLKEFILNKNLDLLFNRLKH